MPYNHTYAAFGLTFKSELSLPELPVSEDMATVLITFGKVPDHLENPAQSTPWFAAKAGQYLLAVDSVARYYVEGGRRIIIEPHAGANDDDIRTFLYDSAFAALLQQNGFSAMHGSAAMIGGKATAILGASSTGKTAVALALYEMGIPILTDEICAVGVREGRPVVYPGLPWLGVWKDTLDAMGKESGSLRLVRHGLQKYVFPVAERFCAHPAELSHIYILENHNLDELRTEPVKGGQKLEALLRLEFCAATAPDPAQHFRLCASLSSIRTKKLRYNPELDLARKIADMIAKEVAE